MTFFHFHFHHHLESPAKVKKVNFNLVVVSSAPKAARFLPRPLPTLKIAVFFLTLNAVMISTAVHASSSRTWVRNTNFDEPQNWDGFLEDCSKNIYSFPSSMESAVVFFPGKNSTVGGPNTIRAKQIILPRNGHLVFQDGLTTLFNSPSDTCQGIEIKFRRTTREDWFDPDNWFESDQVVGDNSLLSLQKKSNPAIPHVERVPCQFDAAQFPSKTSFNLFISSDVAVHKFLLGDKELSFVEIAIMMNTQLGKIQFKKDPDTKFDLTNSTWEDSDQSICQNYQSQIKQKICSLADCEGVGLGGRMNGCSNPLTPPGFCCPICGFDLSIEHSGALRLSPVKSKLSGRLKSFNLETRVATHVTRNAQTRAHIIFIPWMNTTQDVRKLINEISAFLQQDPTVVQTTLSESWSGDSSGDAGKLTSGGSAETIVIVVIICILLTIGGSLYAIFYWKKNGGPPLTFNSVLSRIPRVNFPAGGLGRQRPSFAFARFANERISSINIGQLGSTGNIAQTDKVDSDTNPIDVELPEGASGSEAGASGIGFANVVYDIIGGDGFGFVKGGGAEAEATSAAPTNTTTELNKGAKEKPMPKDSDEHVYDLVEVNGGGSSGFGPAWNPMEDLKTFQKDHKEE